MQLPIWWRRGQQRPWPSTPRINKQHPLAANLVIYIYDLGNGVYIDLVNGGTGVPQSSTTNPSITPNKFGGGYKFAGSAGASGSISIAPISGHPAYTNFCGVLPYSFVAGTVFTATNSFTTISGIANTTSTDNAETTGIAFWALNGTTTPVIIFDAGGTQVAYTGSIAADFQTWGCIAKTATTADLYRNGALDKNASAISATNHSVGSFSKTGAFAVNGSTATGPTDSGGLATGGNNGFLPFFAGWNRGLTSAEFSQVHQDPYCFLIYPEDEMFAAWFAAATATPAFGWQPEAQALRRRPILRTEAGPQFVASPSSQNFSWFNAGWEIPPPMVRRVISNRQPVMPKEDGISDIQRNWFNAGWEVQPPQPPHPRAEKFGSIAPKEDGTEGTFQFWKNAGWEIQPPPPPHPKPEKFGSIVPKDDGNEGTFQFWRNAGWEIQSPMIEHPKPEKAGAIMPKDDGIQAIFQNWQNAGWEVQSPQPPRPTQWRAGGFVLKEDGIADILRNWQNSGWEAVLHQPQHLRIERAGAIMPIEPGNQFPLVVVSATPAWQFDPTLPDMRRVLQRWFLTQPVDGIESPFQNWQNAGWEIQSPQPPHLRPEKVGSIMLGDGGIQYPLINWFNAGWEIQAVQPPHTRWERAGGIMPIEPGNEGIFVFQTTTVPLGFDPAQIDLRRVLRRWFISQPVDGIESPYVNWQNDGWEVQPYQPQHLRPERVGALMRGDDGTQSQLINWAYMGWEVQPPPPPHPRPERAGSLGTVFNIDAPYSSFVPLPAYEVQSPQPPRQWWERRTGALANFITPPDVFVPPAAPPWGFEPTFTYKILRNYGLMAEMVRQGSDLQPFGFVALGWPIQPWQPPHPRFEREGALIFPFIDLSAIVPPPIVTVIPRRTLMGMGL